MCGLIGVKNLIDDVPVNQIVRTIYENQKDRGSEGFGFVGLTKKIVGTYRAVNEKGIFKYLADERFDEILFHHRLPTSTKNTIPTTHPFKIDIKDKRYYFAHNGVISNDYELLNKHTALKIDYKSLDKKSGKFNDSESLAWEFCLWLNGMVDKFEAKGSVAFLCLELDKNNHAQKFYFYRNKSNPLKLFRSKQYLQIASEGGGHDVKANQVYYYDYESKQIEKFKPLVIKNDFWGNYNSNYDRYSRYDYYGKKYNFKEFEREFDEVDENNTTSKQRPLPLIDLSDENNIPTFSDSDDEGLLNSIFTLRDMLQEQKDNQAMLIVDGLNDMADDMTDEIEEIEDLIDSCNLYFNNPYRTARQRNFLMSDIANLALEY